MRNHELFVGEVVFDLNKIYFGVITDIVKDENGKVVEVKIDMNGDSKEVVKGWCEYENKIMIEMIDCEITENDLVWTTDDIDALYQVAWGVKDSRTENIVCYEHQEFGEDFEFPYYSPYLEENLFNFEVEFC